MFFLFAGDNNAVRGGAKDFKGAFVDEVSAETALDKAVSHTAQYDWAHLATVTDSKLVIILEKHRERY